MLRVKLMKYLVSVKLQPDGHLSPVLDVKYSRIEAVEEMGIILGPKSCAVLPVLLRIHVQVSQIEKPK